jgi:lysophospholipase L1-like esterase
MTRHLKEEGFAIELVANPSVTGWTSAQLIEHELPVLESSEATFATVLIGVNDWVQGVTIEAFREHLRTIVDGVQAALVEPRNAILVTIPDFSLTPEGGKYARGRDIAAGLSAFNDVITEEGAMSGLPVVDIFPLSQTLAAPGFVAADGLHPSGAAYARWESLVYSVARELLMAGAP